MTAEVVLRRIGNSTGITFAPSVLRDLGLKAGQALSMVTTPDGKITLSPKRKFALADLIAQCDLSAPPPADLAAWDTSKPVGQEVW